jgi:hypothetical protein
MKKERDLGWLWHFLGGAAIALAPLGIMLGMGGDTRWVWSAVPVSLGLGTLREWLQHRDDVPVWTGHRWSEALAWGIGSLSVACAATYWLSVIASVR